MPDEDLTAGAGRLVALVVTFNRLEQLKITLDRLLASPPAELEGVVVVDNASTDGTGAWLAGRADPRLEVISCPKNLGGAGGFELGMRQITAQRDPDWIVLMDDDGRPEPGALAAFHGADPGQWDAVAAAVYYPDGRICEMNRPSRNPFWHGAIFRRAVRRGGSRDTFHIPPAAYDGPPLAIDITSFVGFFVSRAAVARFGYPDGALFVYGEDGIYSLGLSAAGGRIAFLPAVRFEHDCRTLGEDRRFRPLWKVYYYHRNLLMLYRMAAGPLLFWPLLLVILPKWLLKVRHHSGTRGAFLRLLARAVVDGLRRRTGTDHAALIASLPAPPPAG
ncbi:glycosyltransferase [Pseudooceanicola nanhaiensis]|uniref:glycosyltransferase n=1 Tax=Pseudooceanicola nanhaiensis TaxID=375761 RepID=UPI001CD6A3BF|nr:glycosyltransferase [Pseudooceanicola nanhaiensis]MCA0922787.1 glycosyltransferase [Pseudooceanicola nanhaiensis]